MQEATEQLKQQEMIKVGNLAKCLVRQVQYVTVCILATSYIGERSFDWIGRLLNIYILKCVCVGGGEGRLFNQLSSHADKSLCGNVVMVFSQGIGDCHLHSHCTATFSVSSHSCLTALSPLISSLPHLHPFITVQEYEAQIKQFEVNRTRVEQEEKRKTLAAETKQHQEVGLLKLYTCTTGKGGISL